MSRVVVTGSAGHLGEALVRTLRERGADVVGLDVLPSPSTDVVASVTDSREYATCTVHTATIAAATAAAVAFPNARRASHDVAAIDPSAKTTATIRAVSSEGSSCHAWNGAWTYISSVG